MTAQQEEVEQAKITFDLHKINEMSVWIKGATPLVCNALSPVGRALLTSNGDRSRDKDPGIHGQHPYDGYRSSVYQHVADDKPTRIKIPAAAIRKAMLHAARYVYRDTGALARLRQCVWVREESVDVYGVPKLLATVLRAGLRGPVHVRTCAILPQWCFCLPLRWAVPELDATILTTWLEYAGLIVGTGGQRPELGKGLYGRFQPVEASDCTDIVKAGGREAQDAALERPEYYDDDTAEIVSVWLKLAA